jgi:uncharacterized membrane protein
MSITWTVPSALWLLLAVPVVWVALRFGRTNFNSRQKRVQAVLRSLLLVTLAAALARPVISLGSSRLSVVYVVDASHSISARALTDAAARIDALTNEVRPAHSRIVAFGATIQVLDDTEKLRALAKADPTAVAPGGVERQASDLERALTEARAEIATGHLPRIVLFSDGWETSGDVHEAVTRLAEEGVPVFVEPLAPRELGDAWVNAVHLPAHLSVGAATIASVELGSQKATVGQVEIRQGTKILASQPVKLDVGSTTVPLEITLAEPGPHALDAVLTVPGDPLSVNNKLTREALVSSRPRVLYVEGSQTSAHYLQRALDQVGFDVALKGPAALPTDPNAYDAWDAVILSDIARASVADSAMTALGRWVEHDGGGLLVVGGEAVFGEGNPTGPPGYRKTEIERLTPVTFERKDEPEVALIIVLDKSWSMAGAVMELCKSAAQAAIDVLDDKQSVGVITFNDGFNWDVTLRNVGKYRDSIRKTVAAIEPSGHTLIFPALEQAFNALKDARARAKHVVLLSDGRSYPDDYEGLVKKMVEAKMTVSAIAVGPAADQELLSNIGKWGKGRSYIVEDAKEVPQIFVKEAKNVATPGFDEKVIKPVVKARGFLEGVDMTKAPALKGRTAVVLKDTALELLATEDGDPLLAYWPIGLGRTAVFAGDVKDRWATDWLKWRGYGPFFAAVLHAVARQPAPPLAMSIQPGPARGDSRPVVVTLEARDAHGRYTDQLKSVVRVIAGDGTSVDAPARQTAPGRYEARVVANARQPLTVEVVGGDPIATRRLVLPDLNAEYRLRPPNEVVLRAIAQGTGGTWHPDAAAISNRAGAQQTARRALWPWLVVLALALWMLDLVLRRVRIFERDALTA